MEANKQVTLARRNYFAPGTYLAKFKQQFTYAGVANVITTTLLAPLERWRIIAQTQYAYPLRPKKFTSFFNYIKRIPKEQGILSFWRGNTAFFWMYAYQTIFQIGIYDSLKDRGTQQRNQYTQGTPEILPFIVDNLAFPIMASFYTLGIVHPLDTYRVQMNMSYHKNKSEALFTKFRHRKSQLGSIKTLYQGFILANIISIINFNFYKHMFNALDKIQISGVPQDVFNKETVISLMAVALVHPLDTLKKIYQLNNMHKPLLFKGYRGVISFLQENKITHTLYNGLVPSLVRTALFVPIYWQVFKLWKGYLDNTNNTQAQA